MLRGRERKRRRGRRWEVGVGNEKEEEEGVRGVVSKKRRVRQGCGEGR